MANRRVAIMGGLALLVLVVACRERAPVLAPTPGVSKTTIKVGTYGPLSGPSAAWGEMLRGIEVYFRFINARGGIHGRTLELVAVDDQYDPSKTPAAVRRLVEEEEVFAILAGIGTATGESVADYLEAKEVPFFSPASGARFWTEPGKRNVYTVYPRHLTEGRVLTRHLMQMMGKRRIAVLHQEDEFGREGRLGVETELRVQGSTLAASATTRATDTDLSLAAEKIAAAGPDAVIIFAAPRQAKFFVRALHGRGAHPQIATSFVLSAPVVLAAGGRDWEGVVTAMAAKDPLSDDPAAAQFRKVLLEYGGGMPPTGFSLTGFRLAMPFVEALHRAGPELTRVTFAAALETFDRYEGGGPHWEGEGLIGPVHFRGGRRHGHDRVFLARAVKGRWEKLTDWMSID